MSLKNVAPTIYALGLFHWHSAPGADRAELLQVGVRAGSCQLGQEAKVLKNWATSKSMVLLGLCPYRKTTSFQTRLSLAMHQ